MGKSRFTLCLGMILAAHSANAATQGAVVFNGTVGAVCAVVIGSPGAMTVDSALQKLSSKNAGGSSGEVTITTTGAVNFSLGATPTITATIGDTTPTTWAATYSNSGILAITAKASPTLITVPGTHVMTVDIEGVKSGSDTFASGDYQASVIARCEP